MADEQEKPKEAKDPKDMTLGEIVSEMFAVHKGLEDTANDLSRLSSESYRHDDPYPEVTVQSIDRKTTEYAAQEQKYETLKTELDRREKEYQTHIHNLLIHGAHLLEYK